jgi:Galactose oxidase, central domain
MRHIFGFLLMLLGSSGYESVMAQPTGSFTATGNLTTPRLGHSATLLTNGKVLIAGGATSGPFNVKLASAELYDPFTGTFSITGDMTTARTGHTTTLLPNGKVLIAGGVSNLNTPFNSSFLASAELYDPSAGTFISTGNMTAARALHTSTLLSDGKILRAGGAGHGGPLASAELYDPSTGTFGPTANMTTARCEHSDSATLLQDGKVLIVPGDDESVLIPAPRLYSLSGDGQGQGAILHAGSVRVVTASDPAFPGEVLEIYGTGLKDGSVIPPQVAIGGRLAEILYFGKAPGFTGLNQVNVRVPSDIVPGPAVPVRLTDLGRPSNAVTIGVQ